MVAWLYLAFLAGVIVTLAVDVSASNSSGWLCRVEDGLGVTQPHRRFLIL